MRSTFTRLATILPMLSAFRLAARRPLRASVRMLSGGALPSSDRKVGVKQRILDGMSSTTRVERREAFAFRSFHDARKGVRVSPQGCIAFGKIKKRSEEAEYCGA